MYWQRKTHKLLDIMMLFILFDVYLFIALKIHVSPFTKSVLDKFNTFILETRGETEMKVRILKKLNWKADFNNIYIYIYIIYTTYYMFRVNFRGKVK